MQRSGDKSRTAGWLAVLPFSWSWRRALSEAEEPEDDPTPDDARKIVPSTVIELLGAVREMLKDEDSRGNSLNSRGAGLTGFVGVILSLAAAAGAAVGSKAETNLDHAARVIVGASLTSALVVLVAGVITVVLKVLLPKGSPLISTAEVLKYPNWEFISRETTDLQGHLLRGHVKALKGERNRNDNKAKWLSVSYILVAFGLVFVGIAGATATIDRYVRGVGSAVQSAAKPTTGTKPGVRPGSPSNPIHRARHGNNR